MPWIVDGDNVLGSRRDQRRKLDMARSVAALGRCRGREIVLVFDGPEPGVSFPGRVLWSGPGRRADDLIRDHVVGANDRSGWTVVTDDRPLGDRCRSAGARWLKAADFRRMLADVQVDTDKPEAGHDLGYWESVFRQK